jgi:tetratricopeptide (TPR) repeat protein
MSERSLGIGAVAILLWCTGALSVTFARSSPHPAAQAGAKPAATSSDGGQCRRCHGEEVDGFAQSKMAHSMRVGGQEPAGEVQIPGTTVTMYSDNRGSWQKLESHGSTNSFHVDYVIGSGAHASGYIMDLGDHLFQSPVAYYRKRSAYDLAPGYEGKPDPDFTRPIAEACVFCHAGSFDPVAGTQNQYGKVPFPHLAIGCDRCHGSAVAHLAKPEAQNIVNPANLEPGARDSICEQCHLMGVARIVNPGKRFADFKPGERLEQTFTIYHNEAPKGTAVAFKVISHSEQLAMSKCKLTSGARMWCGTCHDPHYEPTDPVWYFRERCMTCHAKTAFAGDHPSRTSNCIGCHMPTREAKDGGHTVFTDHRIQRRPAPEPAEAPTVIAPWREPPIEFATRNLGIASVEVGMERRSSKQIISGYQMLTEVQKQFSEDSEMYNTIGDALFVGQQYGEAVQAFALAVRYDPKSSPKEVNLAQAYTALGVQELAQQHLEKAMELDPLNLNAATLLMSIYDKNGEQAKSDALSKRLAKFIAH